tara:strand:- start:247 stop:654 length:408 start_codon:yes stop_codon:yes gene_type:complete
MIMEEKMEDTLIDEKTKTYLVACLVTGIDVSYNQSEFMNGLVDHLNGVERAYWATGDEDGIILHNKHEQPLLLISYNGDRMTFRAFEEDEFTAMETRKETGLSILNIIDYLRNLEVPFCPSILGSESKTVDEWAL